MFSSFHDQAPTVHRNNPGLHSNTDPKTFENKIPVFFDNVFKDFYLFLANFRVFSELPEHPQILDLFDFLEQSSGGFEAFELKTFDLPNFHR